MGRLQADHRTIRSCNPDDPLLVRSEDIALLSTSRPAHAARSAKSASITANGT
jgi:hypothetical protein